ncbi:hypothetical protein HED60_13625 [Planctomycetales bacterium ZRK34]|nr:hypothetical protein HED60_13625 [Planctomycetales bacterium ZRK34]
MTVTTPDITMTLNAAGATTTAATTTGGDFASLIAGAGASASESREQQVREAAEEFVAMAFVMPLMKMSRNDPFKSDLFHGGHGEETFGAQLDQVRAKQVAPAISKPIVDAIYNRYKTQIQGSTVTRQEVDRHG